MAIHGTVQFETPENITVSYRIAGPGTRYIAFVLDLLILALAGFLLALMLVFAFMAIAAAGGQWGANISGMVVSVVLIVGLSFALLGYFGFFEYFMNGQTPGKRMLRIRVVNERGFALSATAVLLRSIFRIIDTIPVLWLVPLINRKVQRFGDMVAGTIVVSEEPPRLHAVREQLAARDPQEARFQFNPQQISTLREVDLDAMELFLERRERLHPNHRDTVSMKITRGISHRLNLPIPDESDREQFIEDLLSAYARREARQLG